MKITKEDVGRTVTLRNGLTTKIDRFEPTRPKYPVWLSNGNTVTTSGLFCTHAPNDQRDVVSFVEGFIITAKDVGRRVKLHDGSEAVIESFDTGNSETYPVKLKHRLTHRTATGKWNPRGEELMRWDIVGFVEEEKQTEDFVVTPTQLRAEEACVDALTVYTAVCTGNKGNPTGVHYSAMVSIAETMRREDWVAWLQLHKERLRPKVFNFKAGEVYECTDGEQWEVVGSFTDTNTIYLQSVIDGWFFTSDGKAYKGRHEGAKILCELVKKVDRPKLQYKVGQVWKARDEKHRTVIKLTEDGGCEVALKYGGVSARDAYGRWASTGASNYDLIDKVSDTPPIEVGQVWIQGGYEVEIKHIDKDTVLPITATRLKDKRNLVIDVMNLGKFVRFTK